MKTVRKIFLISLITFIAAYTTSYFVSTFLSNKIQRSVLEVQYLSHNIQYLKDLHSLCMLDYMINPNGKDMLNECKKLEEDIITATEHLEESAIYLRLYEDYFK